MSVVAFEIAIDHSDVFHFMFLKPQVSEDAVGGYASSQGFSTPICGSAKDIVLGMMKPLFAVDEPCIWG